MPNNIKEISLEKNGDSSSLVILVHGYYKEPSRLADVEEEIITQLPNADILRPIYDKGRFMNADPFELASNIEALIDETYSQSQTGNNGGYKKITLVGYSMGALLLRKAYVYGMGSTEDSPIGGTPAHDWVRRVDRVVLIAGTNRGWSLDERPEDMNPVTYYFYRYVLAPIFRVLPYWRFLKSFERGSPFVANLRVQWVRLIQKNPKQIAPVVQLLGSIDNLVSSKDDRDLYVHKDFIFIPVQGASHTTLIQFDDTVVGQRCRNKFIEALTDSISHLREKYKKEQHILQELLDDSAKHIVFVLHGIRDTGGWTGDLRKEIERVATNAKIPNPKVVTAKYDFFPMGPFLLLPIRQRHVRWFMDEYTERIATYPNPDSKVSFVGHSNGTYILASALKQYKTMRIHRASFAGSVVPREYPWDQIIDEEGRLERLRNDLAASDWVVALFPKLFDQWNIQDIGSGGFDGFNDDTGNEFEGRYYKGTHGAAIAPANHESLAKFLLTGEIERNDKLMTDSQPLWLVVLSRASAVVWGLILLGVFLLYYFSYRLLGFSLDLYLVWTIISLIVLYVVTHF